MNILLKVLLNAIIITAVTEAVKRSGDKAGALLASLPFVSIIALCWIYYGSAPDVRDQKASDHMWYIFWYVLPTLPMFLLFPWFMRHLGFHGALASGIALTVVLFALLKWAGAQRGLNL